MAKKHNRRRRQRHRTNPTFFGEFEARSLIQSLDDEALRQKYRDKQKEHLQAVAAIRDELLSRTVTVSSVLPLQKRVNLRNLKLFMEQGFGPVEKCEVESSIRKRQASKFPRGRVQFKFRRDAERIFGGQSLLEASKQRKQTRVPCSSVGYKGHICVRPCAYQGVIDESSGRMTTKLVSFNTEELSFGHWFPAGQDACTNMPELTHLCTSSSTFVEEYCTTLSPCLSFDLENTVVEMDVTACSTKTNRNVFELMGIVEALAGVTARRVVSFRFRDLTSPISLCMCTKRDYYVVISLKHPPKLYEVSKNQETGFEIRTRLTSIRGVDGSVFGTCLSYKMKVSAAEISNLLFISALDRLRDFGLFRDDFYSLQSVEQIGIERYAFGGDDTCRAELLSPLENRLAFLMRSVLDNQSFHWFDVRNEASDFSLLDLLASGDRDDVLVERVLTKLQGMHGTTRHPAKLFEALYRSGIEGGKSEIVRAVPEFCVELPRILVTPCRVTAMGFQTEVSNRVVRRFIEAHDFSAESFVRVSIGDEQCDKLFPDDLDTEVVARIKSLVLNGVELVPNMHYSFLAYSSSQLKDLSLWMVCPNQGWTVTQMRQAMGDFSMCESPSKYAARVGQCFSTTVDTLSLAGQEFSSTRSLHVKDDLPDISCFDSSTNREMDHSDGVGLIRTELLLDRMQKFPFGPKDPRDVSAIQVRYGGAKGVLVGWSSRYCQGYDVCLRPSMVKFKASYDRLEIVAVAVNVPYYLNRNVILLGSHLGIPDSTFLGIQMDMLRSLNMMLKDAAFAAEFIPSLSGAESGLLSTLSHMISVGLEPRIDPFLFACLHAIRSHHLMNLRKKARIHVAKGAVLLGGLDETGLVPEGCVFIQLKSQGERTKLGFEPLTGPVMVTKHPVSHPGDMRMLVAVDIPELRDKKNIILFSRHGDRPEADKMSGSDLDGDQFAVSWDRRLFLNETAQPMDYSPPPNPATIDNVSDASLVEHFINHARNNNLGRIAMLWMDHAVLENGAGCPQCLALSRLHSIAVDFPKSGVPAVIPEALLLPRTVPRAHWREKEGMPSFHCTSIVGQLYDKVIVEIERQGSDDRTHAVALAGRQYTRRGQILSFGQASRIREAKEKIYDPMLPQQLGWIPGDDSEEMLFDIAEDHQQNYETKLRGLMSQYSIKSEGEIVTGCILKYHKLHKRRQHEVSQEVRRQFRLICRGARRDYIRAVSHLLRGSTQENISSDTDDGGTDGEENDWIERAATGGFFEAMAATAPSKAEAVSAIMWSRKLAAAYYIATYSPEMDTTSGMVLYSFPWVVCADVIGYSISPVMTNRAG